MRLLPLAFLSLVLAASTACEGCSDDVADAPDDKGGNDLPIDPDGDGNEQPPPPEARVLVFEGQSPVEVFYSQSSELRFFLKTASGQPVSGQPVTFTMTGTGGTLSAESAPTTSAGIALVRFAAGTAAGTATIRASADLAPPIDVVVQVKENPFGTLVIAQSSTTRIPVTLSQDRIYTGAAPPTCAQLAAATVPPTATFTADFTTLPQSRTFANVATGAKITVFAEGFNAAGVKVAEKCVEAGPVAGGATTTVTVQLAQLDSILEGDYDVLMQVDVGNALPSPYDTYVDATTAILSDPAGYAVYQALLEADYSMGTEFIVSYDSNDQIIQPVPSYSDVAENPSAFGTWSLARGILDDMLSNTLGQTYDDVTMIGGDIRHAVTAFEVGARLHVVPGATDGTLQIDERWNDLVFQWQYGCPEGDMGCARRAVVLDDTNYAPVVTSYGATYGHQPSGTTTERFAVVADPHLFALKYGAVVLIALNEVVFPNLPAGIAGNSLEEVLGNIVQCDDVGVAIQDAIGFGSAGMYESFCDFGISFASDQIEQYALSLSVGEGNPELEAKEQEGALGGGSFYAVDFDKDLSTELVRELQYQVQWNDPDDATFSADILAPITGEGRLTAAGCQVDEACDDGFACVPVAHYLKVKQLEMDCRREVGDVAGQGACTQGAECASGICLTGENVCFDACAVDADCGANATCTDNALSLDLDPVLAGLGDQPTKSCLVD